MLEQQRRREPLDTALTANEVMAAGRFVSFRDNGEVWAWERGVLRRNAEVVIKGMVERAHPDATNHEKDEVVAHIRDRVLRDRLNAEDASWPYFGLENGVVDVRPGGAFTEDFDEFVQAHPDVLIYNSLPVKYDPRARCPAYWRFVTHQLPAVDDQWQTWDHFAYVLDKRPLKLTSMLHWGDTDHGKTTQLNVEKRLVGAENCAAVVLSDLCGDDKFAEASLYGKMLNIADDLTDLPLKRLGKFKMLTGGGLQEWQNKGQRRFRCHNFAKNHFAANVPPPMKDVNDAAFWGRWTSVRWSVPVENIRRDWVDSLPASEFSGIFNQLLTLVRRQFATGGFRVQRNPVEVQSVWLGQAVPARSWAVNELEAAEGGQLLNADGWADWEEWRRKRGASHVSRTYLNDIIGEVYGGKGAPTLIGPKRLHGWQGIRLKGDGAQSKITEGERIERVFPIARAKGEDIGGGVRSQKSAQSARVSEGLAGLFGEGVSEL